MFLLFTFYLAIFSLFSIQHSQGTGTQLYYHRSERCCDGTVYNLTNEPDYHAYQCCGAEIYKPEPEDEFLELTTICCGEQLHRQVNRSALCCGSDVYDNTSQACHFCWDEDRVQVVKLSEDDIEKGKTEVCGKTANKKDFYNSKEQICCSGALHGIEKNKECCGDKYIDPTVDKCCFDYVKNEETRLFKVITSVIHLDGANPKFSECCNGSIIDTKLKTCCEGAVVDVPTSEDPNYYPICCGTEVIMDEETQVCAGRDRLLSRQNRNQIPCDGQLHNVSDNTQLFVYCLNGQVSKPNENVCSVNGSYVLYDRTRSVCGNDELIHMTDDDIEKGRNQACFRWEDRVVSKEPFPDMFYMPRPKQQ